MNSAVKVDNGKLQENIERYAKNHFQHKTKRGFTPSLLKMAIHDEKDAIQSPSLLKMAIHDEKDAIQSPSLLKMAIHDEQDAIQSPYLLKKSVI